MRGEGWSDGRQQMPGSRRRVKWSLSVEVAAAASVVDSFRFRVIVFFFLSRRQYEAHAMVVRVRVGAIGRGGRHGRS